MATSNAANGWQALTDELKKLHEALRVHLFALLFAAGGVRYWNPSVSKTRRARPRLPGDLSQEAIWRNPRLLLAHRKKLLAFVARVEKSTELARWQASGKTVDSDRHFPYMKFFGRDNGHCVERNVKEVERLCDLVEKADSEGRLQDLIAQVRLVANPYERPVYSPGRKVPATYLLEVKELMNAIRKKGRWCQKIASGPEAVKAMFDLTPGEALFNGTRLPLRAGQTLTALTLLVKNFGKVVANKRLDDQAQKGVATERLRRAVVLIRQALESASVPCRIDTVRKKGYVIRVDNA